MLLNLSFLVQFLVGLKHGQFARSLGVTGFPTVVVKDDEGYAYLTVGYQPYEQLGTLLDAWLDGTVERRVAQG